MPLSRYLVRNQYGLADSDLFRAADKDDPEALLECVAMVGLVGALRQLGDLAEFAAEIFHDLHEEVMATATRGHALVFRVQQLEAEFPSVEKTLLSQTSHIPLLYNSGMDWHPTIGVDENLVSQGDMPRFIMDSYEECQGPPRLFLLDKFDVAGAGGCLKRYTDPSFFKIESEDSSMKRTEGQREKRTRKVKRRGPRWMKANITEAFPSSHAKLHQLLLDERIGSGANDPERRVRLKKRPLDGFPLDGKSGRGYMQKILDTCSPELKVVRDICLDLVPVNIESYNTSQPGLEVVQIGNISPREPFERGVITYSSVSMPEVVITSPVYDFNEVTDGETIRMTGATSKNDRDKLLPFLSKEDNDEELTVDAHRKSEGSVGEYISDDMASEIDSYVDALATMESEVETDSDCRTRRDPCYLTIVEKMIDSDSSGREQDLKSSFFEYQSVGDSTISEDVSLLKKDKDSFSCSDTVSNFAGSTPDGEGEATAKSPTVGPVDLLAGDQQSTVGEVQGNRSGKYVNFDAAGSPGKKLLKEAEIDEVISTSVKVAKKWMGQSDKVMRGALLDTLSDAGDYQLMHAGRPAVDETADTSFCAYNDVLEYVKDDFPSLLDEREESPHSFSSPAEEPIQDLTQPVEGCLDVLSVLKKSPISVLDHPDPAYVSSKDDNEMSQIEERPEDESWYLNAESNSERQERGISGTIYSVLPLNLSEDEVPCSGDETSDGLVSASVCGAELVESFVFIATDDGMVQSMVPFTNREDLSAPVVDRTETMFPVGEVQCPSKLLCSDKTEATKGPDFDSSETGVARSVDESSYGTVKYDGGGTADMSINMDVSRKLNPVDPSQVDSQAEKMSETTDALVRFEGEMAGGDSPASANVANVKESNLHANAVGNNGTCLAVYPDQSSPTSVTSTCAYIVDDLSESSHAEASATSSDDRNENGQSSADSFVTITPGSSSKHFPYYASERENKLYFDNSIRGSGQAESEFVSASNNDLTVNHAETQGFPPVLNCATTWYTDKQHEGAFSFDEVPCQNGVVSQMWSLQHCAGLDVQNHVGHLTDDPVISDSIICYNTSNVDANSRLANNVDDASLTKDSQTCLYANGDEKDPLSSIEGDHQPLSTCSHRIQLVQDKEHDLDALANALTESQIALDEGPEATEMQGSESQAESFKIIEETSQSLDYTKQIVLPKDIWNDMRNPTSMPVLSAHLSQPLEVDLSVQAGEQAVLRTDLPAEIPSQLLLEELCVESADCKIESIGQATEQSISVFFSVGSLNNETQANRQFENSGQNTNVSQLRLPLFDNLLEPTEIKLGKMLPLPPLPPMQWRLGRNQQAFLASEGLGLMQPFFPSGAGDDAAIRSQKSMEAHYVNPFLSFPVEDAHLEHMPEFSDNFEEQTINLVREDGAPQTINVDQRQDFQLCTGSQHGLQAPNMQIQIGDCSLEPLESGLLIAGAPFDHNFALVEGEAIQKETAAANKQPEHFYSPSEQETAVLDEQLEPVSSLVEQEMASPSAQFKPPLGMQYGQQVPYGFVAPEEQGIWSTNTGGKPENTNVTLPKKIPRPRNPLIDEVVALDKSTLRKVGEIVKPQDKPKPEERVQNLPQLRKVGKKVKPQDVPKVEEIYQNFPPLRKVGERVKPQDALKVKGIYQNFLPLRKVGERVKPQDGPSAEGIMQHLPQLRKVGERVKPQDGPTAEGIIQHLPQLRKVGEIEKLQNRPTAEDSTQHFPELRKAGERTKPQDGSMAEEREQSLPPLSKIGGTLETPDGPQVEGRNSVLEQIRNMSFNLKPAAMTRPSVQGHQTDLKVTALLEKAKKMRQVVAGSDEDESDSWSDN